MPVSETPHFLIGVDGLGKAKMIHEGLVNKKAEPFLRKAWYLGTMQILLP